MNKAAKLLELGRLRKSSDWPGYTARLRRRQAWPSTQSPDESESGPTAQGPLQLGPCANVWHQSVSIHQIWRPQCRDSVPRPGALGAGLCDSADRNRRAQTRDCFGLRTFNAVLRVLGKDPLKTMAAAIDSPISFAGSRIWCQAHTGALGQNNRNRGGVDRVSRDWKAMRLDVNL